MNPFAYLFARAKAASTPARRRGVYALVTLGLLLPFLIISVLTVEGVDPGTTTADSLVEVLGLASVAAAIAWLTYVWYHALHLPNTPKPRGSAATPRKPVDG